jgi:hypothetical protein
MPVRVRRRCTPEIGLRSVLGRHRGEYLLALGDIHHTA